MKKTTKITNLHTDARIFSVEGDDYRADVIKGSSIRIHGTNGNHVSRAQPVDQTFNVGDHAVYGSYNLVYTGEILSITEKTVTIDASGTGCGKKRLPLAVFFARNHGRTPEQIATHNAEEMNCI